MSRPVIRKLLETRLNAISPALATAFENVAFTVVQKTPYQRVYLMFAEPEHPTMGGLPGSGTQLTRENGILQSTLYYPENAGAAALEARVELIRAQFYRGLVLTQGTVRVMVDKTPYTGRAFNEGGFFVVPVSIGFIADVYS